MRRILPIFIIILCGTAVAASAITTPQGKVMPSDAAPLDQQVFYMSGGEPKHLDGARDIYSGAGINVGGEPLIRRDENQNMVPCAADSWTAGPNATYWDFKLRKDAVWSDGKPVTADDWVYTFQHMANPKLGNPWAWFYYDIKGFAAANQGKAALSTIGVEKIDTYTIRVWGEGGPAPHIPALLSYQAVIPVPKHVAEKDPEHWADKIEGYVSSGPYIPTLWVHGQRMEWTINPKYNGRFKPYIQKVVTIIGDNIGINQWLAREIDLIHLLDAASLKTAEANPDTRPFVHKAPNFQSAYLTMDTMKPPLNNLKLRQALSHAIDRDTLSAKVMSGSTMAGYSMLPPGFPGYNADLKKVQNFDVATAKQLLKDAGYADPKTLTLDLYANGRDAELEFVKDQWETNLGIKVNLKVVEGGVWGDLRSKHQMMIYKGPYEYDYLDPANMLTSLWKSTSDQGSPRHAWKSQKFDDLVATAGKTADEKTRIGLYQQAERVLVEDVGAVFLSHQVIAQVWWPYIAGIPVDNQGLQVFRWLDITRYQLYIRNDVAKWRSVH
jgi:oligopeptide transport system substrate-binding protein